jgi:RES domain-containing protein
MTRIVDALSSAAGRIRTTMVAKTLYWHGLPPPFDIDALISTDGNRWNGPGVPTVYLAGDIGLALVEGGRHLARSAEFESRAVWAAWVEAAGLVDLSRGDASRELGVADALWFLDRDRCRAVADRLRDVTGVGGLIVPSAGCPDDLTRTNVVLYVDRMTRPLGTIVRDPVVLGRLERVSA